MLKDCERCNCPERGEFPQGLAKAKTTSVSGQNDKSRQHLFAQHWLRSDTLFTEFCKFFSGAAFGLFFAGFDRHCFHMHCGITIYMEFKSLFKYQNSIINTCCHKCMMNEQCTPTCTSTQYCYLMHIFWTIFSCPSLLARSGLYLKWVFLKLQPTQIMDRDYAEQPGVIPGSDLSAASGRQMGCFLNVSFSLAITAFHCSSLLVRVCRLTRRGTNEFFSTVSLSLSALLTNELFNVYV